MVPFHYDLTARSNEKFERINLHMIVCGQILMAPVLNTRKGLEMLDSNLDEVITVLLLPNQYFFVPWLIQHR